MVYNVLEYGLNQRTPANALYLWDIFAEYLKSSKTSWRALDFLNIAVAFVENEHFLLNLDLVYFGRGMSGIDYSQGEKIIIVTLVAHFQELVMVFFGGPLWFLRWAALRVEIVGRKF